MFPTPSYTPCCNETCGVVNMDHSRAGSSYLVIHDGISQLLDKSSQCLCIVNIVQELDKGVFFRQWPKLRDNSFKLPERGVSKIIFIRMDTNLRSSTLLPFSA